MRFGRKRQDRVAESGGIPRREAPELTLGGGRELDPATAPGHASSGP